MPNRSYFILHGSLDDFDVWSTQTADLHPAFIWPADQAWCLAQDVDPHWAGIGGTTTAMRQLLTEPLLDIVLADPLQAQPAYE